MLTKRRLGGPRPRRLLPVVAGLLLLALSAPGPVNATTKQQLDAAKRKLAKIDKELDEIRAREKAVQLDIESLNTQIAQAIAQKYAIEAHVKDARSGIQRSEGEIADLRTRLNERAREVYIQGPASIVEVVLEAESLADLSDRVSFVHALSRGDANLVAGIDTEHAALQDFARDLVGLKKEQAKLLKLFKRQGTALNEKQSVLTSIRGEVQDKYDEAKEAVEALEAQYQKELLAAIGNVSGGRPPPDIDGKPGPLFACPVDSPRSYINDFGFPRVGHTHQGNDIFAPLGTPIRAPFDGKVQEGSNGLGGLSVHVYASDGTGDYVYNAHLSKYAGVSGHVEAGTLIGYVGDTGNARGTPYHDHFEYHPGGGSAVTPYFYLNEVCGVGGSG